MIWIADVPAGPILPFDLDSEDCVVLDLSSENEALRKINAADTDAFKNFIFDTLTDTNASVGMGGYLEDRHLYRKSPLFNNGKNEPRSVHLGIDLWAKAGTPVSAPVAGSIHSFNFNNAMLDYGATIILEHEHEEQRFWTLYGHLSRASLDGLKPGLAVEKGQIFARLGDPSENGGWAPHLHFQIIVDIGPWSGDFPGVCKASEIQLWRQRCPDPNLILRVERL